MVSRLLGFMATSGDGTVLLSGGVDSALVATILARQHPTARAITITTPYQSPDDREMAARIADLAGLSHQSIPLPQAAVLALKRNHRSRCYACKQYMLSEIQRHIPPGTKLYDGTNADDLEADRPGHRALLHHHVISPLAACGIRKADVRQLARELQIPVWQRPSESCLLTRFPLHHHITTPELISVASIEKELHGWGIQQLRVRPRRNHICIQVAPSEASILSANGRCKQLQALIRDYGYRNVMITADLQRP